ncbi:MAG: hypothetical protein KGP28_00115 [Bdellovibrionales bacterium]|nr:hypothetical protein [Bdellovibrionales bacterium]
MKNSVLVGFISGLCVLVYLNAGNKPEQPNVVDQPIDAKEAVTTEEASSEGFVETNVGGVAQFAPGHLPNDGYSEELLGEISKVKRTLPSVTELRSLPLDEVHGAPARIIEAGAALGDLEEYLEKKPEEFLSASRFFSDCAAGSELPPSVRAMCLHSLRNNPTQWAPGVSAKLEGLPPEVVDLEAQL